MDVNKMIEKKKYRWLKTLIAILAGIVVAGILVVGTITITRRIIYERVDYYAGLNTEGTYPMSYYSNDALYTDEYYFLSYEDEEYTSRRGIDVSSYQGDIDWELVKASGVEFVMIRAGFRGSSQGDMYEDQRFKEYIKGAQAQGLDIGVYFFSQAVSPEEAIEEAKFVIELVKGHKITMPIAFDMEPVDGEEDRIAGLNMEEMTAAADAFCSIIANHGYTPVIYGNPTWLYSSVNLAAVSKWDLWLAYYSRECHFPYHYTMWQYSCTGLIDGINTEVDLNIQFVKKED